MNKILVTGASGFVGLELSRFITGKDYAVRRVQRRGSGSDVVNIAEIGPKTDWIEALQEIDVVVHLAARVHVMEDSLADPLKAFRAVNVCGSKKLARQAAEQGVKRFVFISSVKVNGEFSFPGKPFISTDMPSPKDSYAISKYEAEQALLKVADETGMEVAIIRPPLVYGPGVKANFRNMMSWIYRGIPLPLGSIQNKRSLIALENLVELIETCISHPSAANETFLAADGKDFSTTEMIRILASGMGRRAFLLPVPQSVLCKGLELMGKKNIAQRLCGNLQVDISKAQKLLGWVPSTPAKDALRKTAQDFVEEQRADNRL